MEGWKEEVGDHQVLEVRIWTDFVTVRINERILFDRPSPQQAVVPMEEDLPDDTA